MTSLPGYIESSNYDFFVDDEDMMIMPKSFWELSIHVTCCQASQLSQCIGKSLCFIGKSLMFRYDHDLLQKREV